MGPVLDLLDVMKQKMYGEDGSQKENGFPLEEQIGSFGHEIHVRSALN